MTSKTDIPSSSSYPPPFRKLTYDVFLSFRGVDTRQNFTDHLYNALKQKGIFTFRDDEELERGELIAPSLLEAIEESRYVVVVFSRHYADSSWCLDEIAKVADCMKQMGQKVLPVFYDVDPTDVRRQTGEYFEKAFSEHHRKYEGEPSKVQRWKDALLLIGNLSGWHPQNGSEVKVIQEVVQKIFTELNQMISTSEGLVGMDSHLEIVLSYLDLGRPDDDVRIIGICGMGGIGKSTIAEVVYERIRPRFEGHCFINNVREVTKKKGVNHLQQKLLSKLLKTDVNVENTTMGKGMISHRLSTKKVLLVLDDVDEYEQLEVLCHHTWFGPGSRIIITSRDKHLLQLALADQVYEVNSLSNADALQLFSLKASRGDQLGGDFLKLSEEFIKYADGLPLAIKVLGSSVYGRNVGQWSSALDRLKNSPEKKIMGVLRWSFDGLEESEQRIFLDIACFFKGKNMERVRRILQGSNAECPDFDLKVLLDKSMITLSAEKLWMHHMIQEMGWQVVCQECREPEGRSRLWRSNEIIRILDRSKATSAVQSILLLGPTEDDMVHSLNDSFLDMDNLRLLKIWNVKFSGNIKYLSNELQYLKWRECPLNSFPSNFQPHNLVELKLHSSCIQQLWRGENGWSMLRFIDLRGSKYLRSTPDFTKVPNLEKLNLHDCTSLVNVHPSLGCLKKLDVLDMANCKSVECLPPFTNLESLRILSLSLCSRLKKFPEIEGDMKALCCLSLDWTSIEELPTSVARLTGLQILNLMNCETLLRPRCSKSTKILTLAGCSKLNDIPDDMDMLESLDIGGTAIRDLISVVGMKNLKYLNCQGCNGLASESGKGLRPLWSLTGLIELDLSDCSLMDGAIPNDLSSLISLKKFNLSGNNFFLLPESISQLSKLEDLNLSNCTQLQLVPRLPSSVRFVNARDCNSLMDFPNQIKRLGSPESGYRIINSLISGDRPLGKTHIDIQYQRWSSLVGVVNHLLVESVQINHRLVNSGIRVLPGDAQLEREQQVASSDSSGKIFYKGHQRFKACLIPGDEIPEWFSTKSEGNRISIRIPPKLKYDDKWHGFAMCAVFSGNEHNRSAISLVDPGSKISAQLFQCTLTTGFYHPKPTFIECDEEQFRPLSHLLSVFYIPKSKLLAQFLSGTMSATFETSHPSSWQIQICGIRLVYEQDVGWYDKLFPQRVCTPLHEVYNAIRNSGWISRVDTFWKWEARTPPDKEDSTTILQRKNMESILPRYFEARNSAVFFSFILSGCPGWCMNAFGDRPSSCPMSYRLPQNLYRCKKWIGIVAFALIAEKETHASEEEYCVYIELSIGSYYMTRSITFRPLEEPHQVLFVYIPRAAIIQEFTQTSQTVLRMTFGIDRSDIHVVEVQIRGIIIVDKPEVLEEFAEAIIHCMERVDTGTREHLEEMVVEKWIELLRLQGDSCTPNIRYSRTRRERKFELLSQKYRTWDWPTSAFCCNFLGAELCRKKWFMHYFNKSNSAEIQLPPNLLDDSNWLGFSVCAIYCPVSLKHQNTILDSHDSNNYVLSWHLEFDVAGARLCTFLIDRPVQKLGPQDMLANWTYFEYVPRTNLKLHGQCSSAKAIYWSSSQFLEVRSCALQLVYKDDIEDLVQSLTLCELP